MRKIIGVAFAALLCIATALGSTATANAAPAAGERSDFVAAINGLRSANGLAALQTHSEIQAVAQAWSEQMAAAGRIWHNPNLTGQVSAAWTILGENVGVGYDVGTLIDAFIASPAHFANLVSGDYTHVGVGVTIADDGRIFTAHVFMVLSASGPAPEPAPRPETEPTPEPQPGSRPVDEPAPAPAPGVAPALTAPPAEPARVAAVLTALRGLVQ